MSEQAISKRVLILFAHGARSATWAEPFVRLQSILQASQPQLRVELAYLELMSPQLPELVKQLNADFHKDITIVPIFLGQGGHVIRDLPLIVEQLRQDYPQINLKLAQAAGEDASVLQAIAGYCLRVL